MIHIIGDTADELADLQILLETGMINSNKDSTLDITYKLSSGDILLVDQYNHIVGRKNKDKEKYEARPMSKSFEEFMIRVLC